MLEIRANIKVQAQAVASCEESLSLDGMLR
ncbi:hypothetical protein A0O36_01701 [Piscirickettsiaceae bacterium NZ-RLO1]|nr:hypothetical protein A0O36_01701 [Piscirickettsiaceae bacterium NZ-RLO1]